MSFGLKLDRAREHLQRLDVEIKAWIDTGPHEVVDEPNLSPPPEYVRDPAATVGFPPTCWRQCRVNRSDPVPERFSLLIGDCLFNLRSALDHLAMSLAKTNTPGMAKSQITDSAFPIFGNKKIIPKEELRRIGCIAPAARDIIKAMQPYHRGDAYDLHPLWQIHELNRIDKHRTLTVCASMAMFDGELDIGIITTQYFATGKFGSRVVTPGEMKLDAVLFQYEVIGNDDMGVQIEPPVEVTFGREGPAPFQPVVPTLQALCDYVRDFVIAPLTKIL